MELIIKEAGIRLDKALADLTELSRSQANDEIKKGTVLVNGKAVKAKYAVKVGDVVTYEVPKEEVLEYTAENIPLDIIYEDDDVAVVNKPQGMVVHPSVGHTSGTLVNALMYHIKDLSSINGDICESCELPKEQINVIKAKHFAPDRGLCRWNRL